MKNAMRSLRKTLQLQWWFFRLSAIADLQMPFNIGLQFVNDILWYSVQIALFETIYSHANALGGWTVAEMRVFLGMLFTVDSMWMVLFARNFEVFSSRIVQRDLDLLLLKPVSSQQLMTAQKMQVGFFLNFIFSLTWLLASLALLPGGFPSHAWLLLLVVPAGLSMFYSTALLFGTIGLLVTRVQQLQELHMVIYRMSQRPDMFFGPKLRYFILFVIPVGMIASVPTRVMVNAEEGWPLAALLATSIAFVWLTHRLWEWSVRRYTQIG